MEPNACYPQGFDPDGEDPPVCQARTPGPLGLNDAASPDATAVMGGTPGPLGLEDMACVMADAGSSVAPVKTGERDWHPAGEAPDEELLIIEVEPKEAAPPDESWLDTTVENIARFGYDQRTNWPGGVQDLKTVVQHLREFGGARFYVKKAKNGKRYLIFKGNPRAPGRILGVRAMIRGNGPYAFKNPHIVQLGFGTKTALRAGARATVISFVVVAGIDIVEELMQDEPSLRRLGVNLSVDVVKLILSGLAGVGAAAGMVALAGAATPVIFVAGAGLFVGLFVGRALDALDRKLGITDALQRKAKELQDEVEWSISSFLWRMEQSIRSLYGVPSF